jgi:hypothetical protein
VIVIPNSQCEEVISSKYPQAPTLCHPSKNNKVKTVPKNRSPK